MSKIFIFFWVGICTSIAQGHDYWLTPNTYRPAADEPISVRLLVGDHFESEIERGLQKDKTVCLQIWDSQKNPLDLLQEGEEGQPPLVKLNLPRPGAYLLALERDWAWIEMEAKKFHQYLEHEGLADAIRLRQASGEADQSARERYRRYLKCLLRGSNVGGTAWKQKLGHRLEILPEADPSGVAPGAKLSVQVLFESRPLKNVQVSAMGRREGKPVTVHEARTDADGRLALPLDHAGEWIVRLVHLRRCPDPEIADWESFWAAMTFDVAD